MWGPFRQPCGADGQVPWVGITDIRIMHVRKYPLLRYLIRDRTL